jgi:potassium channel subfamily K, invertebrate
MTHSGASVPVTRSSVRSRSSGGSSSEVDPRERVKACCRKLVEFMFTQVGVGGLVVCYAFVGAAGFMHIEVTLNPELKSEDWAKLIANNDNSTLKGAWVQLFAVEKITATTASKLWDLTSSENVFNETKWRMQTEDILQLFQVQFSFSLCTPGAANTFPHCSVK